MSPVARDPHPTCSRCRGRKCSSDSPCSNCHNWSLEQWELYNKRRSYAERSSPPSRHSGNSTVPNTITSCSPASKSAASAPAPLPRSAPPPPLPQRDRCQGKRRAVRTLSEHGCPPPPPPPPPCRTRGGGWTRAWSWLRVGVLLPFLSLRRGEGWSHPILSHLP